MNWLSSIFKTGGLLLLSGGCSAYIEDFGVADTQTAFDSDSNIVVIGETDAQTSSENEADSSTGSVSDADTGSTDSGDTDTDTDADTDADTDSDSDVTEDQCEFGVVTPSGTTLLFCPVAASTTLLGCHQAASKGACADDELPLHPVVLSAFEMMKYEVSNAQFAEFVSDNPDWGPDGNMGIMSCNTPYLNTWYEGTPLDVDLNKPVTAVCLDAAQAYCEWLGPNVSLPTEAQFEKAARGDYANEADSFVQYPFGDTLSCMKANYQNCYRRVLDVGTTTGPSPYGVLDMAGNVAEWTSDLYRDDYYCNPTEVSQFVLPNCNTAYSFKDPTGSASGTNYVVKGGSWSSPANALRISARNRQAPRDGNNLTGFRCVRNR
ncbi:MAG: formylglycine-generating enzyme family protein [Deltaproteobacteria bacterium]|nr:formylglycine-generating enzyme family protein [Deltaproteobacteria bacterium]